MKSGVVFWLTLQTVLAVSEDSVVWYQMDLNPVYIHSGDYAGKGLQDSLDEILIETLRDSGYTVETTVSNVARIMNDLESKKQVACGGLLQYGDETEDPRFYSSLPHTLTSSVGVVVLEEEYHRFVPYLDSAEKIDLSGLLMENDAVLGIAAHRQYYRFIDSLIDSYAGQDRIYVRSGEDLSSGLFQMLIHRRIDYTLMFPWEASYTKGDLGYENRAIRCIPVQNVPEYVFAVMAAPRNEWGRKIIEIANERILEVRNTSKYHRINEYWLSEAERERYRGFIREYYTLEENYWE